MNANRANKHNRNSKSSISATVSIYVGEIYVAQKDAVQPLLLFSTLIFFFGISMSAIVFGWFNNDGGQSGQTNILSN